ncbi:MAG: 50S ribosomal protein L11 methyltransferase [Proteobacteria bacterium]|nr:50S ribosomal protein L11 methyltransferase [Pseudomonadota bacterium]MBU4469517.1 50S ribosomal protein L11 methyltransferase [Pseudomonadota bacterium]MCG2753399.1 50S ribosomal protein L11 methyltransferase [Desulfobacteraceae bacterium]
MKWLEAKVILENEAAIRAVDVISVIFTDMGLSGTVLDDPSLEPEEGWGNDAIPLPEKYAVTGYFAINEQVEEKRRVLEEQLRGLKERDAVLYEILYREMDEEDWAESWKEHFWPERVTDRMVVKPTWREFNPAPGDLIIEIDPGMAFGTGTHPTTASCVKMIEKYLKPGDRFLDVGTGSGILMVAAGKLGASRIEGIDTDEMAVSVAEKNLVLNRMDSSQYALYAGDLVSCVQARFDVVAANILSEVIVRLLEDIHSVMAENGILICSGIVEKNSEMVIEKMKAVGLEIQEVFLKEGWATIVGKGR